MSTAQAAQLRLFLQNLCDSGAAINAFPDAAELRRSWGASQYDVADLVSAVRKYCPGGYFVPYVCKHTNMKVIMCRGNGNLFTVGLMATMASISYCRTRLANLARDFRRMASAFPPGAFFRQAVETFCGQLETLTAPAIGGIGGPLAVAVQQLPLLARRASAAERHTLTEEALRYSA